MSHHTKFSFKGNLASAICSPTTYVFQISL